MPRQFARIAVLFLSLAAMPQAHAIGSRIVMPALPDRVSETLPEQIVAGNGVHISSPIPGAPVTSPFGWRVHPILNELRFHPALDFGARAGTLVLAAASGTVTRVGHSSDLGVCIVIRHANGTQTAYNHLSAVARGVRVGRRVRAQQTIGRVGNTGLSTGPHLDFQVSVDGYRVDPAAVLAYSRLQPAPAPERAHTLRVALGHTHAHRSRG